MFFCLLVLWTLVRLGLNVFLLDSKIPCSAPLMFAGRVLEVLFGIFFTSFHICFLVTLWTPILLGCIVILCIFYKLHGAPLTYPDRDCEGSSGGFLCFLFFIFYFLAI